MKRTHHCNELRPTHIGQTVSLSGWVHSRRDLGGVIFIDVRDREGRTQSVFDPSDLPPAVFERAAALRNESVVRVVGKVRPRPAGTTNPKIPTGEIEVLAQELEVLNLADPLPFQIDDPEAAAKVNEELRLTYRYLDLRRGEMARNLRLRHKVATATRVYFDEQGFLEVETPLLFKSTPEGAREFVVPCRTNPGLFYALPQSPQQFKQILMVAGVERYFQLAKCFRDEDLRADRQPEFTQIDVEMSFIDREDLYTTIEGLLKRIWKVALNLDLPTPFRRLPFVEALNRFGSDKPDLRLGLELVDLTEEFRNSQFKVFAGAIQAGGVVKAINAKGSRWSRSVLEIRDERLQSRRYRLRQWYGARRSQGHGIRDRDFRGDYRRFHRAQPDQARAVEDSGASLPERDGPGRRQSLFAEQHHQSADDPKEPESRDLRGGSRGRREL